MSCFRRKANRRYTVIQIDPQVAKKPSPPPERKPSKPTGKTSSVRDVILITSYY